MTREEAIEILNRDDDDMRKGYFCINDFLAIEVLKSEEPCEDAISRRAVLEYIEGSEAELGHDSENEFVRQDIKELPPVNPQEPRWIPVSDRLPEDRDWYLGIFKEPDTGWINPLPFICDYVGRKTKATTKEHWILRGFTDGDEHIDYYYNLECVAWMPLPEPYKAESERDKCR